MTSECYKLDSIGLRRSNSELLLSGKAQGRGGLNVSYEVESFFPEEESDKERFDLMVSVFICVTGVEADTENEVFKVETLHYGGFVVDDGVQPCDDDSKLAVELSKQIFPVCREHANELMWKMGFRGIYLPWTIETHQMADRAHEGA